LKETLLEGRRGACIHDSFVAPNFIMIIIVIIVGLEFPNDICKSILCLVKEVSEIITPGLS
jgi:hypothetical protein